jgi:hypothetical protein
MQVRLAGSGSCYLTTFSGKENIETPLTPIVAADV